MRIKILITLLSVTFLLNLNIFTQAQEQSQEEGTRGFFLSTRPTRTGGNNAKINKGITTSTNGTGKVGTTPETTRKDGTKRTPATHSVPTSHTNRIGLGYTLYLRDREDRAIRVDPAREFRSGEAIRVILEPNIDGYLYIFHTENDGKPGMLFPDVRLKKGDNAVRAHVPYEVPSGLNPNPKLRWFVFYDGPPATERLYIVVSHQPLPEVPIGENLLKHCQKNKDNCPWQPTTDLWALIKKEATTIAQVSKDKTEGQLQSRVEKDSISRAIGLDKDAPPPSTICLSPSAERKMLVTLINLTHK
ncbi:MAG: DUF4384 domain-containing protein [Acidobacteriota bacterium]